MSEMDMNEVIVCENCECEHHNTEECLGNCLECVAENNSIWGEIGQEIPGKFYQVYNGGKVLYDDESIYYSFDSELTSEVIIEPAYSNFKANKFGKVIKNEEINVIITVNETLAGENPLAHVVIDDKIFDLGILKTAIKFFMNKDHKISIHWKEDLIETFRFIALK